MLKFSIPAEKGNEAAKDGTLGRAIDKLIEQVQPEASYFFVDQGIPRVSPPHRTLVFAAVLWAQGAVFTGSDTAPHWAWLSAFLSL